MSFMELIKKDLKSYVPTKSCLLIVKTMLINHSFHLVLFVRLGQSVRRLPILGGFLGVLIEYLIRIFFASDISCKAKIGGGLMIVHGHDIVIGSNVVIKENCKIFNGVTLGTKNTEVMINLQPEVGNNVVLGTGSKILGGIKIGDNVKTGANSVVITDIPENSIAIGVPAKIIKVI